MKKPPHGYGQLIDAPFTKPDWLHPEEIVARHLRNGLDERMASEVPYWHHPFRVRANHPFYINREEPSEFLLKFVPARWLRNGR